MRSPAPCFQWLGHPCNPFQNAIPAHILIRQIGRHTPLGIARSGGAPLLSRMANGVAPVQFLATSLQAYHQAHGRRPRVVPYNNPLGSEDHPGSMIERARCNAKSEILIKGMGPMNRRDFMHAAGLVSAGLSFSKPERLVAQSAGWRTFEVTTRVEVMKPSGTTHVWLPAALTSDTPYQKTLANTFQSQGGSAKIIEIKTEALAVITAEFPPGVRPLLTGTSRIATRNWAVDLSVRARRGKTTLLS